MKIYIYINVLLIYTNRTFYYINDNVGGGRVFGHFQFSLFLNLFILILG